MLDKDLIDKVKRWGFEKGIDKAPTVKQREKTKEELIEIRIAYGELVDGIGDSIVTLIMQSITKVDLDIEEAIIQSIETPDYGRERNVYSLVDEAIAITDMETTMDTLARSIAILDQIAFLTKIDLREALSVAYDEIKGRKGEMIDGKFVKEVNL